MTAAELERFMARRGLDRDELAELLSNALGTRYSPDAVKRWGKGERPVPKKAAAFLEELALEDFADDLPTGSGLGPEDLPLGDGRLENPEPTDTSPGGPAMPAATPAAGGASGYTRACEELWELVATGVGMLGGAIGSQALLYDSQIILADKAALGAAWGKLAQSNDTFRRMLVGMTEGGAWLQVAVVTGSTVSKCWQMHQQLAAHARMETDAGANGAAGEPTAAAA